METLLLDLLEWLRDGPRPYADVMDAWRTSCPRLPVWEEANDRGYVARRRAPSGGIVVSLSRAGAEHLQLARSATTKRGYPISGACRAGGRG